LGARNISGLRPQWDITDCALLGEKGKWRTIVTQEGEASTEGKLRLKIFLTR